jgi:hypothetical protein
LIYVAATRTEPTLHTQEPETPVFLGARRRVTWLRAAGLAAGALVVLWLVALVAGVLGFGNVTGLSLPGVEGAKTALLHRSAEQVTAAGIRRTSSASLRSRGTPAAAGGHSQVVARRLAGGQAGSDAAHRRAVTRPSTAAPGTKGGSVASPSAGAVHGNHLGNVGSGTTSPSTSKSHRSAAPGHQRTVTTAPTPSSPNARRNRLTATG